MEHKAIQLTLEYKLNATQKANKKNSKTKLWSPLTTLRQEMSDPKHIWEAFWI